MLIEVLRFPTVELFFWILIEKLALETFQIVHYYFYWTQSDEINIRVPQNRLPQTTYNHIRNHLISAQQHVLSIFRVIWVLWIFYQSCFYLIIFQFLFELDVLLFSFELPLLEHRDVFVYQGVDLAMHLSIYLTFGYLSVAGDQKDNENHSYSCSHQNQSSQIEFRRVLSLLTSWWLRI